MFKGPEESDDPLRDLHVIVATDELQDALFDICK